MKLLLLLAATLALATATASAATFSLNGEPIKGAFGQDPDAGFKVDIESVVISDGVIDYNGKQLNAMDITFNQNSKSADVLHTASAGYLYTGCKSTNPKTISCSKRTQDHIPEFDKT